jgi:hypothetical protein
MSLFEQASLVITPTAYKAGKLYAIKPTNGSGDLSVVRATTATRVNGSGLVETVAIDIPRLDYTSAVCPSILVETQRTNVTLRSEEFVNPSWIKTNTTATANTIIAPSGNLTADTFSDIIMVGNNTYTMSQSSTYVSGTPYSVSIYVKNLDRNYFYIRFVSTVFGTNKYAYFNVQNGTLISADVGVTASIINMGNGWYRCIATSTASVSTTSNSGYVFGLSDTGARNSYPNPAIKSVYIWGAQLEAGSNATSYIQTIASTMTRNADFISKTGISSLIGQTEGTIFAQVKVTNLLGIVSRNIFSLSNGTADNRIFIAFSDESSNVLRARIFNGSFLQCSIESSTITTTGTYKLALAYKNNDIVFYINGVQIGTDTSATIPTCGQVDLGQNYANASQFNDSITNADIWKERLTNAQLALLTTL